MKIIVPIFMILSFIPTLLFANYLQVNTKGGKVSHLFGDGYEEGVEIRFPIKSNMLLITPLVHIPKADNTAECQINEIKKDETNYSIKVDSSVLGDSGGCIIWIKHPVSKRTIALVTYDYVTE